MTVTAYMTEIASIFCKIYNFLLKELIPIWTFYLLNCSKNVKL